MTADVLALLQSAAARYGLDPALVIAQANAESGGRQYDSSGNVLTSSAGALGVMQLMPATAAGLGVDPTDTAQNIDGGVRYLAQLIKEFGGNTTLALAAYNWGPGNVSKNGLNNWPTETMNYVSSIMAAIGNVFSPSDAPADPNAPPDTTGGTGSSNLLIWAAVAALALWGASEIWG